MDLKPQDLNQVVAGFQKMLHRLIAEDIDLTCAPAAGKLVVNADKGQIEQVLMNLVTNARDAMRQGGEIRIATERRRVEQDGDDLPFGDYAVITLADDGSGMDQETLKRIFEPFYTTKPVGQGTGLGLSIVYGVVIKHMGAIRVESFAGQGTTFSVYLPLMAAQEAALAKAEELPSPGGSETLLLIEDDQAVRDAVSQILEQSGYRVLSAGDGEEGVARFREHKEKIDLVLSDLLMPKRNGLEVLAAMREEKREVRVIFMSGYTADILNRRGIDEEGLTLLRKPLNPGDLLRKIREVLAA